MSKKKLKKVGRPLIVIDDELCKRAEGYAAQGLTMNQIASVLGISETTLYDKQSKFSEFSDAIKRGKNKGIATITNALFNKAREGDNTAMIFYLKNQAGWQDKIEKETSLASTTYVLSFKKYNAISFNKIIQSYISSTSSLENQPLIPKNCWPTNANRSNEQDSSPS